VRLTPSQRAAAPVIHRALTEAAELVRAGERDAKAVTALVAERIGQVAAVDYAHAVEADTLRPLDLLEGEVRLLVSATFGDTPLVDNIGVTVPGKAALVPAGDATATATASASASAGNDTTKGAE
jgi:pantoate--beta-alanine ligase